MNFLKFRRQPVQLDEYVEPLSLVDWNSDPARQILQDPTLKRALATLRGMRPMVSANVANPTSAAVGLGILQGYEQVFRNLHLLASPKKIQQVEQPDETWGQKVDELNPDA